MVYIKNNAPGSTEYHEAFHVFTQLVLNEKQRKQLYKEASTRYGIDVSDTVALEEAMAETAEEYFIAKDKKMKFYEALPRMIKRLFETIYYAIKRFVNAPMTFNEAMYRLDSGVGLKTKFSGRKLEYHKIEKINLIDRFGTTAALREAVRVVDLLLDESIKSSIINSEVKFYDKNLEEDVLVTKENYDQFLEGANQENIWRDALGSNPEFNVLSSKENKYSVYRRLNRLKKKGTISPFLESIWLALNSDSALHDPFISQIMYQIRSSRGIIVNKELTDEIETSNVDVENLDGNQRESWAYDKLKVAPSRS